MSIFNLPDLGEGLPDAEIQEWHVKEGDKVAVDQALVSVETAKAVVEVPSPQAGIVKKLFGHTGDIIKTGAPLIEFESDQVASTNSDEGTVVGKIQTSSETINDQFQIGFHSTGALQGQAVPAARILARSLGIDLNNVTGTGPQGTITVQDIQKTSGASQRAAQGFQFEGEPLKGFRRTMAYTMSQSHQSVVPVTIFEDANVSHWDEKTDITVTIIRSLLQACSEEPNLNAWFDGTRGIRKLHESVDLGLAVDSKEGLFVPVIKNAAKLSDEALRSEIDQIKELSRKNEFPPEKLQGATITLSNFGNYAGKYATPIIVPPMVAIIGIGKLREQAIALNGDIVAAKILPLSVTFDHRSLTGGEATRFLSHMIAKLETRS